MWKRVMQRQESRFYYPLFLNYSMQRVQWWIDQIFAFFKLLVKKTGHNSLQCEPITIQ